MDFSNPFTLLFILPLGFLAFFLLKELLKGGGDTSFKTKFFSLEKKDTSGDAVRIEALTNEIHTLTIKVDRLQAEIMYMRGKDGLKYEFKSKLSKINKKFYVNLIDLAEELFAKRSDLTPVDFRVLDEYRILVLTMDNILYSMTKKGMDDFDKNGFNKVGLDANGNYDSKIQSDYVSSKPEEYAIEISKVLTGIERPMTIPHSQVSQSPVDRKIIITLDEFESCALKALKMMDSDIKELYDFIVTRYRAIDEGYRSYKQDTEI